MADTIYGYVAMANAAPVAKFTDASGPQTTVMDDIAAAGDVETVLILKHPLAQELSSPTIETGQSFVAMTLPNSPLSSRVLFETAEGRLAFLQNVLPQWGLMPTVRQGPFAAADLIWEESEFHDATLDDAAAMDEIEAAPDVQGDPVLQTPRVTVFRSYIVRPNERVIKITTSKSLDDFRVRVASTQRMVSFFFHFVMNMSRALELIADNR